MLDRWRERKVDATRWVVVDTETSGFSIERDALLAIGGVAIDAEGVRAHDSFEVVLHHQGTRDRANIAVHGIGRDAQRSGIPAPEALARFDAWAGDAPRVAFHADFDRAFIERAGALAGLSPTKHVWLDAAPLAAALAPRATPKGAQTTLDDFLALYGIECDNRHNAASDALATAELLLRLRAAALRQGVTTFAGLMRIAQQARWLGVVR
ncbi:MAG TPA: 3'-5' exonuclease [Casimicrobiaceae bacterium]|nr:3'-5' exonuclease [Casimicrobiaceae bacterium]